MLDDAKNGGGGIGRFDSVAANRIACWDRMPETEGRVQMRQAREDMTSRGTHTRCCLLFSLVTGSAI